MASHIKFSTVIIDNIGLGQHFTDITERKLQEETAQQQIKLQQEYAKLHGVVNLLREMELVNKVLKMILNENLITKLNESIRKLSIYHNKKIKTRIP